MFLTGHTGFKGAWMTLWLASMGAEVFGYALEPITEPSLYQTAGRPAEARSALRRIEDAEAVNSAMQAADPEIVIHMAAQALVHSAYLDPAGTFMTNVMGAIHVLEASRLAPSVRVVINVTSDKCYENREQIWGYREEDPMGGSDPYSASKGCAELATASWRRSYFNGAGVALASARAGNVIGGGDWSAHRLVPDCVRAFQAGEPVSIRSPAALRPWQHVLEPLSGYLLLAEALWRDPSNFSDGWNFGPEDVDAQPVGVVVEKLAGAWGEGASWTQDEAAWAKEARVLRVDPTKARLLLGWKPRLSLDETLEWTADWYKDFARGRDARELCLHQIRDYSTKH